MTLRVRLWVKLADLLYELGLDALGRACIRRAAQVIERGR